MTKAKSTQSQTIQLTDFGKDIWLAVADIELRPLGQMHVGYCKQLQASGLLETPYHYYANSIFTKALKAALDAPSTAAELYQSVAGEKEKRDLLEKCFSGL